jgi:hypothetical protein
VKNIGAGNALNSCNLFGNALFDYFDDSMATAGR